MKKVIPLTWEGALPIYAQTQQRFLIFRIRILVNDANVFSSQDEELLSILQHLQQNSSSEINSSSKRIVGYFYSDTVLNLRSKVLTDTEINILEKGLDFAPILNETN